MSACSAPASDQGGAPPPRKISVYVSDPMGKVIWYIWFQCGLPE